MKSRRQERRDARVERIIAGGRANRRRVERRRSLAAKLGSHEKAAYVLGCERIADALEPVPPVERLAFDFLARVFERHDPGAAAEMSRAADDVAQKASGRYVLRPLLDQLERGDGSPRPTDDVAPPAALDRLGNLEAALEEIESFERRMAEIACGVLAVEPAPAKTPEEMREWWTSVDGTPIDEWAARQAASLFEGEDEDPEEQRER